MTYDQTISTLESLLSDALKSSYPDIGPKEVVVSIPTDKKKADFVSNISFLLSKEVQQPPIVVAQKLSETFTTLTSDYTAEPVLPGFINFRISDTAISSIINTINLEKDNFGRSNSLENQTWVVEHTSPNPNKAMHIGHLRNNLIGMTIGNILSFSGAKVILDWVDNDRGIAITKAMWGYLAYKQKDGNSIKENLLDHWNENPELWLLPGDVNTKADHFVGDCYLIGSDMFKQNKDVEEAIRKLALDWESGDEKVRKLWELIISFAHTGVFETLNRIGNHWDYTWHEHEHYQQGKQLVQDGLEKNIFKQLPDGAVLTQLEEDYKLPDTIVLKSDGTSLYITQDIALTKLKKETYKADKLLWVIGPEQTVAMKQVFAVCEQLGIGKFSDFIHVPYGLISVSKDGVRKKMSSRGGEALLIDVLLDEVKNLMLDADRGYSSEEADRIAVNVVKFAMLKPARNTDTVLDISQAISLEGDSGVYILYTMARMRTLISKNVGGSLENVNFQYNVDEHAHAVKLLYLPKIIKNVLSDYSPNSLAEFSLDIAHSFNSIYAKERFISDDIHETQKKLQLTAASLVVLETLMKLLGISQVEEI